MAYQLGHTSAPRAMTMAGANIKSHANWSPYDDNGGTTMAVAGEDYCIVAASTRLSTGYSILTRQSSKLLKLTDKTIVACASFQADYVALLKLLQARNVMYQHNHGRPLSVNATAQLLSNTLYMKRFFPYYAGCMVAGLDEQGRGAVYTYDSVGSYERTGYFCQGSGRELIQVVLDNQLKAASPLVLPPKSSLASLPLEQALDLVKDAFVSAGERDIYTGDDVEILILTKDGIRRETLALKRD